MYKCCGNFCDKQKIIREMEYLLKRMKNLTKELTEMHKDKKNVKSSHNFEHQEAVIKGLRKALSEEQKVVNNFVILNVALEKKIALLEPIAAASGDFIRGLESRRFARHHGGLSKLQQKMLDALEVRDCTRLIV